MHNLYISEPFVHAVCNRINHPSKTVEANGLPLFYTHMS